MFLAVADLPGKAEWVGEPHPVVVGRVRQEVGKLLDRWGASDVVAQEAGIVVGELLANVVVHARTTFRLEVQREGLMLRIAVEDGCVAALPVEQPSVSTGKGLGLRLVNTLALRWGWCAQATGKTVWAVVLLD
jgi:anti-sigma regulatory factor (Ser/Thr protein kinase)